LNEILLKINIKYIILNESINSDEDYISELEQINNSLLCEIEKLNLKNNGLYMQYFRNIDNYYSLLQSSLLQDNHKTNYINYNNKIIYPFGLFDLLSLSICLYIYLLEYLKKDYKNEYVELLRYFSLIINITNMRNIYFNIIYFDIDKLFLIYIKIKREYINGTLTSESHKLKQYRNTLALLLDGLFILALLLLINGIKNNNQDSLFTCIIHANGTWNFWDLEHKKIFINNFIKILAEDNNRLYKILKKDKFFVFDLIKSDLLFESYVSGGKKTKKTKNNIRKIEQNIENINKAKIKEYEKLDDIFGALGRANARLNIYQGKITEIGFNPSFAKQRKEFEKEVERINKLINKLTNKKNIQLQNIENLKYSIEQTGKFYFLLYWWFSYFLIIMK